MLIVDLYGISFHAGVVFDLFLTDLNRSDQNYAWKLTMWSCLATLIMDFASSRISSFELAVVASLIAISILKKKIGHTFWNTQVG